MDATIDSPTHKAYSLSPVKLESQRMLLSPRRTPRTMSKVPYKVLDAPELAVSGRDVLEDLLTLTSNLVC
ncbi:hypothetical protein V8E36_004827 [Tilletia maclaganii]